MNPAREEGWGSQGLLMGTDAHGYRTRAPDLGEREGPTQEDHTVCCAIHLCSTEETAGF